MLNRQTVIVCLFSEYLLLLISMASGEPEPEIESEEKSKDSFEAIVSESAAEQLAKKGTNIGDDVFIHGFLAALSVIIVSELGDKTFFIAAIM